jgi:uncharacterized membrane protein
MTWFLLALVGPLMYALTNHIDKLLLEKYFKKGGVGVVLLFSSLLSIFALPFFFLADKTILDVSLTNIFILAVVGILYVLVLWCYLFALKEGEASVVIIFYQLVPVFGYILGYFLLGEVLTPRQLFAMVIIILGTTIVSFEIDVENKFKLRKKIILPMMAASFFWASGGVIFKMVALQENLWRSLFWEHLMLVFIGIIMFITIRPYRVNFLSALKVNSRKILTINAINEGIYILGNVAFDSAYLLAPVALVLLTDSFQSIFALIIGIFLTIFFPKLSTEKIQAKHIWQKIVAICITGVGAYLLLS